MKSTQTAQSKTSVRVWIGLFFAVLAVVSCTFVWRLLIWEGPIDSSKQSPPVILRTVFAFFTAPYFILSACIAFKRTRELGLGIAVGLSCWVINRLGFIGLGGVIFHIRGGISLLFFAVPAHVFLAASALIAFSPGKVRTAAAFIGMVAAYSYAAEIYKIKEHHPQQLGMEAPVLDKPSDRSIYSMFTKIDACLLKYSTSHPEIGFPKQLEDAEMEKSLCLNLNSLRPKTARDFNFKYNPIVPDSGGPITHFVLLTQLNSPYSEAHDSFFSDESGIIHRDDGTSNSASPVLEFNWGYRDYPAEYLAAMVDCLAVLSKRTDFHVLLSLGPSLNERDCSYVKLKGVVSHGGYKFNYRGVTVAAGSQDLQFTLTARPEQYGINGVRSYFVDQALVIHATPQDRDAMPTDPEALRCEFNLYIGCDGIGQTK